ncbi:glutaredoxin domain-containing protein [Sediminibacillus halophilus]|uniref:Glutaredoxin-like protein NrdH n=1 Tax=Sediminibacillus halophilus TaxID=482461 RepID=A0A1G9R135_9BACI|nr:glutaredoxin domain-containing protein [Sediminibacillus halophilus]SDM17012.1 glutaredoxin-like protein NrdH [Sediminibacillus halophilus]
MAKQVIIYSQETCSPCQAEKEWLKHNGIAFEDRDIRSDSQYMNEVMALGASATPVTVIQEGDEQEVVMGFDKERLSVLLGV